MIFPPRGAAGLALAAAVVLVAGFRSEDPPLWPGARFTAADRDCAEQRGLLFLYRAACRPDTFRDWGHDLLSAFANIASTNANRVISDRARRMGHERALEWRRLHRRVPPNAGLDDIANLVYGSDAADQLGVPDRDLHDALVRAAARFSTADFLGFDPRCEPPPARDRYDIFQDALIDTYTFDHYRVSLGAHHADVLRWLPALHPYPAGSAGSNAYYDAVYTATHVVYTANSYNQSRVSRECFPQEFAYLNENLGEALAANDPETLGEYLDSLQAFGLTWSDARIRRGVEILLAAQNPDGSWGDPRANDIYVRYHSTWTALNGIQDYRPRRVRPCPKR